MTLFVREENGDLLRAKRVPQSACRDLGERLPIGVGKEGLGEPRQGGQVRALRFDQPETAAREGRQPPDQQPRKKEDPEGDDVARILDRQGVTRRDEEKVETQRRHDRRERARAALPDPGRQEHAEQEEEGHGGVREAGEELQDADRRENEENRGGGSHPPDTQGLEHTGILVGRAPCACSPARDLLLQPLAWKRTASPELSGS